MLDVIDRFKNNRDLRNEYGPNIRDIEAVETAKYLQDKPEIIAEIETSLAKITSQSERDAIITAFNHLPKEQMIEIAERLILTDYRKAMVDGVNMLYEASRKGSDVKSHLTDVIQNSKDSKSVFTAVRLLHVIMKDNNQSEYEGIVKERLERFINDPNNKKNRARALDARIENFIITDETKEIIITALKSETPLVQFHGIIGLDHVFNKQYERKDPAFDWRQDANLKALLDSIVADETTDLENKREVLNVMLRNYNR